MFAIICGWSALSILRTPPALAELAISAHAACAAPPDGAGLDPALLRARKNVRPVEASIKQRLTRELKGALLPIDVMCEEGGRKPSALLRIHRIPPTLDQSTDLIDLGAGLYMTTPAATLAYLARTLKRTPLAELICELAGLYAICPKTALARFAQSELIDKGGLLEAQQSRPDRLGGFCNKQGKRLGFLDRVGRELPWEVSIDRHGRPTDLWKRAPLVSLEELSIYASRHAGERGNATLRQALAISFEGLGSPLETKAALLMLAPRGAGGEGAYWPAPLINAEIPLADGAKTIAGQNMAIADQLYEERRAIIELNGEGYHADRQGFRIASGRTAALEHMGYRVFDIDYGQVSNLEKFQLRIESIAHDMGIPLAKRTSQFLNRQAALHAALFPRHRRRC